MIDLDGWEAALFRVDARGVCAKKAHSCAGFFVSCENVKHEKIIAEKKNQKLKYCQTFSSI